MLVKLHKSVNFINIFVQLFYYRVFGKALRKEEIFKFCIFAKIETNFVPYFQKIRNKFRQNQIFNFVKILHKFWKKGDEINCKTGEACFEVKRQKMYIFRSFEVKNLNFAVKNIREELLRSKFMRSTRKSRLRSTRFD